MLQDVSPLARKVTQGLCGNNRAREEEKLKCVQRRELWRADSSEVCTIGEGDPAARAWHWGPD